MYTDTLRYQYGTGGAFIDAVELPVRVGPRSYQRDGGFVDSASVTEVRRVGSDGQVLWLADLGMPTGAPWMTAEGEVVAVTAGQTQVVRFDQSAHRTVQVNCMDGDISLAIVYADASGYVLEENGRLIRYEGP